MPVSYSQTCITIFLLSLLTGGASTGSAEAIGLNLQRAIKAAGLNKVDMANVMQAQRAIAALEPDPALVAKLLLTQKAIAASGVPAGEIARVLGELLNCDCQYTPGCLYFDDFRFES